MAGTWARYEERVRLGCEAFELACRRNGFSGEVEKRLAKEWAQGCRDWLESFGEDWQLLGETVDEMRKQHPPLIVASPRSCIKVARDLKQWRPRFETESGRQSFANVAEDLNTEAEQKKRQRYAEAVRESKENQR
jgi:hypothetical protein